MAVAAATYPETEATFGTGSLCGIGIIAVIILLLIALGIVF